MSKDLALSTSNGLTRGSVLSQTLWITAFAAATAVGARVEIPHSPVPYTLQTLFVLLAGAFLGARNGALSQFLYLGVGALGAPVFSLGGFGLVKLLGPTGGYLLAFPFAAAIVGIMAERMKSFPAIALAMATGLLAIFLFGTLHLNMFYLHDIGVAFTSGFLIFSWWDMLKLFAAASIYFQISKRWRRVA
jgi:biotin transport system substrate-specific component